MDKTYDIRKIGGDKIALLGLFIVALLIAHLIVVRKSALVLSEPIKLPHTDLSVSMPAGNGWESEKQWKYRENAFSLISTFTRGTNKPTAWVQCRYLLAAEQNPPQMRFKQQASEVDGEIVKTDQTKTDALTFDWALIEKPQTVLGFIFGTANLPDNRQLDIEVHQVMGDSEMAERAFKSILKSLTLKDNRLLEAGAQIIAQIKSRGLDSFVDNQKQKAFFLIKDSTMRTIGFTMDVLADSGRNTQLNIQAVGLFSIRDQYVFEEQLMSFQGTNNLDEFTWKSETSTRTSRSRTEIILDETGPMTIRKFGPEPLDKNYLISPAAIPNIFIEQIFNQMLEGDKNEIIVDIIEANGKIIPILISRIEDQKDFTTDEEAAYLLKLEFLDGRGFYEQVYLNDQKQTYKMLLQQQGTYIFESTTVEEILTQFPERAEYILRTNEILR
jgi:hypothetical protein